MVSKNESHKPDRSQLICYLCGSEIKADEEQSKDHVFQQQFLKRSQPKTKGYRYAGKLITHLECNEKFGEAGSDSEVLCKKALSLIWILWNSQEFVNRTDPNVRIIAIDSLQNQDILMTLSLKDNEFFGIDDFTHFPEPFKLDPNYLKRKPATDPYKKPIEVSLSVLTKSATAFLVRWYDVHPSTFGNILVIPLFFHSESENVKWEPVFGEGMILEDGIKIWIKRWSNNDRIVIYQMDLMTIIFNFRISPGSASSGFYEKTWIKRFDFAQRFIFKSNQLIDLVGYEWSKHLINQRGRT